MHSGKLPVTGRNAQDLSELTDGNTVAGGAALTLPARPDDSLQPEVRERGQRGTLIETHKSISRMHKMKRVVPCHETVYNIMFEKTSGKGAKWFTSVMSCIVIVSIIFFCMSTMPVFSTPEQAPTFDVADDIFNLLFTVEFIVRCTVICFRPDVKKELFDFFMVVDFLAILPALIDWLAGKPLFEASAIIDPTAAAIFLVRTHAFVRRLPASFSMVAAHAAVS
jgi:hypothetical protein